MFVAKSQNAYQYWCSADLRHAGIAIDMVVSIKKRSTSITNNGMQFGFAVEDACGFMDN